MGYARIKFLSGSEVLRAFLEDKDLQSHLHKMHQLINTGIQ